MEIHNHHVSGFEQILAHAGGRDQQTMLVQSDGKIARCSRSKPESRKPLTKEGEIPSQLSFCLIYIIHLSLLSRFMCARFELEYFEWAWFATNDWLGGEGPLQPTPAPSKPI